MACLSRRSRYEDVAHSALAKYVNELELQMSISWRFKFGGGLCLLVETLHVRQCQPLHSVVLPSFPPPAHVRPAADHAPARHIKTARLQASSLYDHRRARSKIVLLMFKRTCAVKVLGKLDAITRTSALLSLMGMGRPVLII